MAGGRSWGWISSTGNIKWIGRRSRCCCRRETLAQHGEGPRPVFRKRVARMCPVDVSPE
jgi:hypothetical protein